MMAAVVFWDSQLAGDSDSSGGNFLFCLDEPDLPILWRWPIVLDTQFLRIAFGKVRRSRKGTLPFLQVTKFVESHLLPRFGQCPHRGTEKPGHMSDLGLDQRDSSTKTWHTVCPYTLTYSDRRWSLKERECFERSSTKGITAWCSS